MRAPFALLLALCATAAPAAAQDVRSYDDCLALVETAPDRAREEAARWERFGGGDAALHCEAMALAATGATAHAAEKLDELARHGALPDEARAEVLGQAAEMWRDAGATDAAQVSINQAVTLAPRNAALLELRALLAAADEDWNAALIDLNSALVLEPGNAQRLALRAAARRRLGDLAQARADAEAAVAADPKLSAGWFELGAAQAEMGEIEAAQGTWLEAIRLDPDGASGGMARMSLERLATQ